MTISTVFATICILIEIYHLMFRTEIKQTNKTVITVFKSLTAVDVGDYYAIHEILDDVPMKILHKYLAITFVELFYWVFCIGFIFILPNYLGILIFAIILLLSLIAGYNAKHKDYRWYDTIDSIICIVMYIIIILL